MLSIDIAFKHRDLDFTFKAAVERGKPHTFEIGEEMLADKLFWVLVGLDHAYEGKIEGEGVCFNASSWNNVLALGDKTMFIRGSVRRNIYTALRTRAKRAVAKQRTEDVINLYNLQVLAGLDVKLLTDAELLTVSIARAHYRQIALVVSKSEIDFTKWPDAYIIRII